MRTKSCRYIYLIHPIIHQTTSRDARVVNGLDLNLRLSYLMASAAQVRSLFATFVFATIDASDVLFGREMVCCI